MTVLEFDIVYGRMAMEKVDKGAELGRTRRTPRRRITVNVEVVGIELQRELGDERHGKCDTKTGEEAF